MRQLRVIVLCLCGMNPDSGGGVRNFEKLIVKACSH